MRRVYGMKVTRLNPGGLYVCPWLVAPRGTAMGVQKSAEVIVAAAHGSEGPNMSSRTGTERSMVERDAGKRAEKPEQARKASGGTAHGPGAERQAAAARNESTEDETPLLMEEVCARENLMNAYKRVVRNGGAPGVDGMTVDALMAYCQEHWARLRIIKVIDGDTPHSVSR